MFIIYYLRRRYKRYKKRSRYYLSYFNNRYRYYNYFDPRRTYYYKSERIHDRLERKEAKIKLRELRTYERQWRKERFIKFKNRIKSFFTPRKVKHKSLEDLKQFFVPLDNVKK